MSKCVVFSIWNLNVRYWTLFWPKYPIWAPAGTATASSRALNQTTRGKPFKWTSAGKIATDVPSLRGTIVGRAPSDKEPARHSGGTRASSPLVLRRGRARPVFARRAGAGAGAARHHRPRSLHGDGAAAARRRPQDAQRLRARRSRVR